jgi:hypothetical protein
MHRLFSCSLILTAATLAAAAHGLEANQIHAFAPRSLVVSQNNNDLGMDTRSGSPAWTEAALNINDQVSDKLWVGVQRHYTRPGAFGVDDMAGCHLTDKFQASANYSKYTLPSAGDNPANNFNDWVVSGRYDFNSNFHGKLEGHLIDGNAVGFYGLNNPTLAWSLEETPGTLGFPDGPQSVTNQASHKGRNNCPESFDSGHKQQEGQV